MRIVVLALIFSFSFLSFSFGFSLDDAQKDYLQGNYEEAIKKAAALRENPDNLYFLGLAHIKIGEYQRARGYFRKLIRRFPKSSLYEKGMVRLADTYFLQKEYENAFSLYTDIRKANFSSDNEPLILLRLAQITSRRGQWQEKTKYINIIKSKYPRCPEMKFVKYLDSFGDFFTIQVGAFSERKNALGLADELKQEYTTYIIEDKKDNFPIYKVRVGRYKKRFEAQKVSKKLLDKGYPARIYP